MKASMLRLVALTLLVGLLLAGCGSKGKGNGYSFGTTTQPQAMSVRYLT